MVDYNYFRHRLTSQTLTVFVAVMLAMTVEATAFHLTAVEGHDLRLHTFELFFYSTIQMQILMIELFQSPENETEKKEKKNND